MNERFVWLIQILDEFGDVYKQVAVSYGKLADFIKTSENALIRRSVKAIGNPSNDKEALIVLDDCNFTCGIISLYE